MSTNPQTQAVTVPTTFVGKMEYYLKMPERRDRLLALAERDPQRLDRILTVALKVVARDEKLQKCSLESVLQAVADAVEIGLEPSGVTGEAYLIPRKGEACFQPSYRGKAKLAFMAGWDVEADVICRNDSYRLPRGTSPAVEHEYAEGDRGEPIWFYAVGTFMETGYRKSVVMSVKEVNAIRDDFGFTGDGSPWKEHYVEMGKKTVLHRLEKILPCSPKMHRARELDSSALDSETVRGRVVPANESATPPPEGARHSGANAPGDSAAGEGGASTAPSPSPAPAPAAPPKKNGKAKEAMAKNPPPATSACPDCLPATAKTPFTPCVKHSPAVEKIDRPSESKRDPAKHGGVLESEEAEAGGAPPRDDAKTAQAKQDAEAQAELQKSIDTKTSGMSAQNEDPGPCTKTDGCHRVDGHLGDCTPTPQPTDSAISDIVTQAVNSGNPCKKTKGCILENGHPPFCKSKGAAGGLFAGKA